MYNIFLGQIASNPVRSIGICLTDYLLYLASLIVAAAARGGSAAIYIWIAAKQSSKCGPTCESKSQVRFAHHVRQLQIWTKIGCAIGQEGYPVLPEYTNSKNLLARACCRRGPPTRLCTVFNFIARQERPAGHSGFEGISGNHNLASLWIWRERSAGAISAGFG